MTSTTPILSRRVYDFIKLLAQIVLPAIGAAYFSLADIWNLPMATEVVGTIAIVDTFLGVLLSVDKARYEASGQGIDGQWVVDREDGIPMKMKAELKPEARQRPELLAEKDQLVFKVVDGEDLSV